MIPRNNRSPRQLLVEGDDDKWAVINLMVKAGYSFEPEDAVFVRECKGITRLLDLIPEVYKQSGLSSLGIIVDSDLDPPSRWASLRARLQTLRVNVPEKPDESGTIVTSNKCSIGIWMMPDNQAKGMLENFLAYLIPDHDKLWGHAVEATDKAISMETPFLSKDRAKGQIHSWLAWQREPGKPIGTAISAGFLSGTTEKVSEFKTWFSRLFEA